jgi:hypothetical protein
MKVQDEWYGIVEKERESSYEQGKTDFLKIPMGASNWANHGIKWGYGDFFYGKEMKKAKKQAITDFMRECIPKEKEEIKPTEYHYICYGGSVNTRIDSWGKEKIKQCPYKGEVNWMVKACEKCDGNIEGELRNDEYEIVKNREIREYNNCLNEIKQNYAKWSIQKK